MVAAADGAKGAEAEAAVEAAVVAAVAAEGAAAGAVAGAEVEAEGEAKSEKLIQQTPPPTKSRLTRTMPKNNAIFVKNLATSQKIVL